MKEEFFTQAMEMLASRFAFHYSHDNIEAASAYGSAMTILAYAWAGDRQGLSNFDTYRNYDAE